MSAATCVAIDTQVGAQRTVGFITQTIIDDACDYGAGDPLRWSPTAVERYLMKFAARKVLWGDGDALWVPDVLTAFARYAARKKGLPKR